MIDHTRPADFGVNYIRLSKLCAPTPRLCLRRERLLIQLGGMSQSKVTLLCAEGGYGKTTLLLDFLHLWPHPAVWYRLDKTDRDVAQFVAYLTAGLAQHFHDLRSDVRSKILGEAGHVRETELRHLLLDQLYEISTHAAQPFLVILDGFESVASSREVCALLSDLLEYSGPAMRFAIASRTMPPLPIARLTSRQEVVILRTEDLAFNVEESRELLTGLHQVSITDEQLDILWQRTQGWPAGLLMTAEAFGRNHADQVWASLEQLDGTPDIVYRYFADEVFSNLGVELQDLLVKTSILRTLSHDVVNELLGIRNAGELLAGVRESGAFAHGMETGAGDLRYHPLFRSFLMRKLHERYGDEQIRDLYRRAAGAACRYCLWSDAIDYYSAAEDWEEVEKIVEQVGEQLTRRGLLETVRYWLDRMPDEHVSSRPVLLMLRGRLLRQAGRYHEALHDLGQALHRFEQLGDRFNAGLTQHEVATVHYWLGEYRRAEAVLDDGLHKAGEDSLLRSWLLADLARNCASSDELDKAVRWAELAITTSRQIARGRASTMALARSLRFRGRGFLLVGEYQRGLQDLSASVELCRRDDVGDLQLSWALLALGQGLALQGLFGQSCHALDEAEALAHGSRPLLSSIWTWRGTSNRDAGLFDRAEHDYQLAGSAAQRELAFLRLRQDRVAEALYVANGCYRSSLAGESPGERAACQVVYGIALARAAEPRLGLKELVAGVETLRQRGHRHQLASAQWHLARLLLEEGRRAESLDNLEEAVLWACTGGVYHFWWWDPATMARLWPLALEAGWAPAYLFELAQLRFGPEECPLLYQALDSASPAMRPQVAETLRAVSKESVVRDITSDLLRTCHDTMARRQISEALATGLLGPHDLGRLRAESGLTWKEIQVLIGYYLRPEDAQMDRRFRQRLAESLTLSEHTLKVHIRNIRRKLDLSDRRRGHSFVLSMFGGGAPSGDGKGRAAILPANPAR